MDMDVNVYLLLAWACVPPVVFQDVRGNFVDPAMLIHHFYSGHCRRTSVTILETQSLSAAPATKTCHVTL
jgi:hypothetical protein